MKVGRPTQFGWSFSVVSVPRTWAFNPLKLTTSIGISGHSPYFVAKSLQSGRVIFSCRSCRAILGMSCPHLFCLQFLSRFFTIPPDMKMIGSPRVSSFAAHLTPPMPLPNVVGGEMVKFGNGDVHEPAQPAAKETCKIMNEAKFT